MVIQERNNHKAFPNVFTFFSPALGTETAGYYCCNCKVFYKNASTAGTSFRTHMQNVHGFVLS